MFHDHGRYRGHDRDYSRDHDPFRQSGAVYAHDRDHRDRHHDRRVIQRLEIRFEECSTNVRNLQSKPRFNFVTLLAFLFFSLEEKLREYCKP